jgi:short-subunit dehydrogenase
VAKLKDKVVVVTGASAGIGRAAALAFADRGAAVALVARRKGVLEDVAEECRARGAEALAVPADVADAAAVEGVAREVAGRFGRIDVWVNNAGVNLFARLEDAPVNAWYRVIETNLFGTYHGIRSVVPWMREQGSGVIINVSSVLGKLGSPFMSSYVASKHGMRALSDCVRQELLDAPGIKVCTVLPGPVDTPLFTEGGNYTGREVKPLRPVIAAERVAATIVACAARPRREAIVGVSSRTGLAVNRLVPALAERVAARQIEQDHFGAGYAPPTDGKIFEPLDGGAAVSGGWTRAAEQVGPGDPSTASGGISARKARLAVVGAAVAAGAGVAAVVRSRRG